MLGGWLAGWSSCFAQHCGGRGAGSTRRASHHALPQPSTLHRQSDADEFVRPAAADAAPKQGKASSKVRSSVCRRACLRACHCACTSRAAGGAWAGPASTHPPPAPTIHPPPHHQAGAAARPAATAQQGAAAAAAARSGIPIAPPDEVGCVRGAGRWRWAGRLAGSGRRPPRADPATPPHLPDHPPSTSSPITMTLSSQPRRPRRSSRPHASHSASWPHARPRSAQAERLWQRPTLARPSWRRC